jgi:hypothetical protein
MQKSSDRLRRLPPAALKLPQPINNRRDKGVET